MMRKESSTRIVAVVFGPALLLTACGDQQVTYTGLLVPLAGSCDPAANAVLVKHGRYVQFTPQQGVLVLSGQSSPAGVVTAVLDTQGGDRKPYHLTFSGALTGESLAGEYVTPRCRYRVELHQAG